MIKSWMNFFTKCIWGNHEYGPEKHWNVNGLLTGKETHHRPFFYEGQRVQYHKMQCLICQHLDQGSPMPLCEGDIPNHGLCQNTADGYSFVPKLGKTLWLCPGCCMTIFDLWNYHGGSDPQKLQEHLDKVYKEAEKF